MTKRVVIVVTHLLGAGHLTRAAALAGAFARRDHLVTLISGGIPSSVALPKNIDFIQLPPVQIRGTDFSTLLDDDGRPVTSGFLANRRESLVEVLRGAQPDTLVTELFPFGRRVLAEEFLAVLREVKIIRPKPLVLSSIRDILVAPTKPERVIQTMGWIEEFYDAVLVHGDPALAPLDQSWPVNDRLEPYLHYTGYVDEATESTTTTSRAGIVVSGGSSPASLPLYRAALTAAHLSAERSWHILVGRRVNDPDFRALKLAAPAHVTVERSRPDFRQLLSGAELSVSQAGYNTCVDILRSGTRAILVPFEANHETEQRARAECLQRAGIARVLPEDALTPQSLANAVTSALSLPAPPVSVIELDGAFRSVEIAEGLVLSHPALRRSSVDFSRLDDALTRARDRGYEPTIWWRDDDAVKESPELDRLLLLNQSVAANLAIAAIPQQVEASLLERLRHEPHVSVFVHGHRHANHAPLGGKKAEFGPDRDHDMMTGELKAGLNDLRSIFGDQCLPVFVPPWNRIAPALIRTLPQVGYVGLSTFGDRKMPCPTPGLLQINTHIDPIDWHGGRSLRDVPRLVAVMAAAIDSRATASSGREPIGLLTHHLVHDERVWAFCEELLVFLARKGIHFAPIRQLFCDTKRNVVEP